MSRALAILALLPVLVLSHVALGATAVRLVKSVPAAGARIKAPRHVILTFSDSVEPAFSGALLLDREGKNFSGAPVKVDRRVITITPDRLAPGRYRVVWHAVAHDGHRRDGEFRFTVFR
jgi:methionine-rich copper-binding protein CopC